MYQTLAAEALGNGIVCWVVKPKFHLMAELAAHGVHTSRDPSNVWTYADEDFFGVIFKLAYSRGGKRKASTVPTTKVSYERL